MPEIYYLGDGGQRGAYYFHAPGHRGWVVADLDTGKAILLDKLVRLDVTDEDSEVTDKLERRAGLAQAGQRWLVTWESAITLFRDHAADIDQKSVVVYEQGGSQSVMTAGAVLSLVGKTLRSASRNPGFQE